MLVAPVSGQSGGADVSMARSIEGVLDYLAANPAMAVIGPSVDVSIGGLPAKRLDLTRSWTRRASSICSRMPVGAHVPVLGPRGYLARFQSSTPWVPSSALNKRVEPRPTR